MNETGFDPKLARKTKDQHRITYISPVDEKKHGSVRCSCGHKMTYTASVEALSPDALQAEHVEAVEALSAVLQANDERRDQAHEARLHTLDQICRLRDRWRNDADDDGGSTYRLWSELDDILNEHFAKIVSGNYDLAKGLPETLYILTTELAEERLRADKAQHDAAVLRKQLTDAETMYRIDRDVYEEIKAIARGCKIDHTRDPQWVIGQIHEYIREIIPEDLRRHGENCDARIAELENIERVQKEMNTSQGRRLREQEEMLTSRDDVIADLRRTNDALRAEISSQREKIAELTNQVWSPENHPSPTEADVQHLQAELDHARTGCIERDNEIENLKRSKQCPNPEVHAEVGRLTRANDELSIEKAGLLDALNARDADVTRAQKGEIEQATEARRLAIALETALEVIRLHELARTALVNYHQSKDALSKIRESARVQEKAQAAYWTEMSEVDKQRNEKEHELLKLREIKEPADGS